MHKLVFLQYFFFNVDTSINIANTLFKFSEVILNIITEGTVSQIFYLGPRSYFM